VIKRKLRYLLIAVYIITPMWLRGDWIPSDRNNFDRIRQSFCRNPTNRNPTKPLSDPISFLWKMSVSDEIRSKTPGSAGRIDFPGTSGLCVDSKIWRAFSTEPALPYRIDIEVQLNIQTLITINTCPHVDQRTAYTLVVI
jgi:hypothetical protein